MQRILIHREYRKKDIEIFDMEMKGMCGENDLSLSRRP